MSADQDCISQRCRSRTSDAALAQRLFAIATRQEYYSLDMRASIRVWGWLAALGVFGCGGSTSTGETGGAGGAPVDSGTGGAGATSPDSGSGGSGGAIPDSGSGGSGGTSPDSGTGGTSPDSGSIITGKACGSAAECGAGYDCNLEAPGGYCMQGSPGGPTACHEPDAPCTAPGSVCSPLPWHAISGVCLRACTSGDDCRANQICAVVELFPGDPTSPKSPTKVCWTACQPGMNQSCNDNPLISSIHGVCEADGTCTCNSGFAKNPDTGRCL